MSLRTRCTGDNVNYLPCRVGVEIHQIFRKYAKVRKLLEEFEVRESYLTRQYFQHPKSRNIRLGVLTSLTTLILWFRRIEKDMSNVRTPKAAKVLITICNHQLIAFYTRLLQRSHKWASFLPFSSPSLFFVSPSSCRCWYECHQWYWEKAAVVYLDSETRKLRRYRRDENYLPKTRK